MAETKCFTLVRGKALRVTRLDACGVPVLGPDSVVITKGIITVALTANTDEGTDITVTNFNGEQCIRDEADPQFLGYTAEIALCGVDPALVHLLTGQPVVLDGEGNTVGFRMNSGVKLGESGFAIEMWSGVPAGVCGESGDKAYGYFLLPFLKGGVLGDFTVGNDAVNFTVSNAKTKVGSGWGVGPFDVTRDDADAVGPLNVAIDDEDHLHLELVTVAPPTNACGASALGVLATGVTAGIPATLTPTNSYASADLATLITDDPLASPATAWTTGQYVLLRDGSQAHWDGTDWVADAA